MGLPKRVEVAPVEAIGPDAVKRHQAIRVYRSTQDGKHGTAKRIPLSVSLVFDFATCIAVPAPIVDPMIRFRRSQSSPLSEARWHRQWVNWQSNSGSCQGV